LQRASVVFLNTCGGCQSSSVLRFSINSASVSGRFKSSSVCAVCQLLFARIPLAPAQTDTAAGQFIAQQAPDQRPVNKMIGLNVLGPNDEKIGAISEILLDKNGNAEAVVIGVGGFLGIGTKDVAVPFKSLQWKMERSASTTGSGLFGAHQAQGQATQGRDLSTPLQPTSSPAATGPHAVLNMTQDQLKAAPEFKYTGGAARTE